MTVTESNTRTLPIIDGWVVRDLPNGDQVRARLHYDEGGYIFEPERGGTGVLLVRERDGYGGAALDEHDGLRDVLDRTYAPRNVREHVTMTGVIRRESEVIDGEDVDFTGYAWLEDGRLPIPRQEFVRRYLRAFHGVEDAFLHEHHGHSQSDWADIWVIVEEADLHDGNTWTASREVAESIVREWSDWAKGDVYLAESEYRTLADAMEAEDFDEGWTHHETLSGGIGDDGALSILHQVLYAHPFGDVDITALPEPYEVTK